MLHRNPIAAALAAVGILAGIASTAASAGEVVLSVSGKIAPGAPTTFDMDAIRRLPRVTIRTSTPWGDGTSEYVGASASDLMELVGASGTRVMALALNDYASEIPIEDFSTYGVVVAYEKDGHPLSIADKGPLLVMYPYDSDSSLQNQAYWSRGVWQLSELVVE